jgi:EAL domain-containing protein (putative c-di-GMP-specific phosphodiesterase class I)
MRLFYARRPEAERLLWSRDIRFAKRLAAMVAGSRVVELESGTVLIAPAHLLTEDLAKEVADSAKEPPEYGLVMVDWTLPEADRYLIATSAAVQLSGLADRIGMARSSMVVQTKMLDYFFSLRTLHRVAFQPIVELGTGELHEYECLFRPQMPMLPQSITSIVSAAIYTERSIELDLFIIGAILERAGRLEAVNREAGKEPRRFGINFTPASLLDPAFEAKAFAAMVRAAGLSPSRITVECTEQQSVADLGPLKRQVKALRRLGFGFAVDDAGAGYASFALVAALRPTIIKIDREITFGISHDDAKQALVEAFVSFGRRINAKLVAEGIENRKDLAKLRQFGVDYGQGYLFGKPAMEPAKPRRVEMVRRHAARVPSRA